MTATGNERLAASLKAAKKMKFKRGDLKTRLTPRRASKLRKEWLESQNFVPTKTMRIHEDAVVLAHTAWPNCYDRVRECSAAIRAMAARKIGLNKTDDFKNPEE